MSSIKYGKKELFSPTGVWVVGDVHGDLVLLERIVAEIFKRLLPGEHVVFCGDYINGLGNNPVGVLLFLAKLKREFPGTTHMLLGNHEEIFLAYLLGNAVGMMEKYGKNTLDQMERVWDMGVMTPVLLSDYLNENGLLLFMQTMIPYYETEHVLITHAPLDQMVCKLKGIERYENEIIKNPAVPSFIEKLGPEIRWQFTDEKKKIPWIKKFRISGHQYSHSATPRIYRDCAFIDTGCGKKEGKRRLTALHWPSKKFIQEE